MAANKKQSPNNASPEDQALVDEQLLSDTEAERLRAERDAITKRLRKMMRKAPAGKSALALEQVVERQTASPAIYPIDVFTGFANARCKAGASEQEAVEGIFAIYRPLVEKALAEHRQSGEAIEAITARMLGRVRGHRGSKAAQ
jgi:hypothetical protein